MKHAELVPLGTYIMASSDILLRPRWAAYPCKCEWSCSTCKIRATELMQIHHSSYFPEFWRQCMPAKSFAFEDVACASNYKTTSEAFITSDHRISGAFRAGRIRKDRWRLSLLANLLMQLQATEVCPHRTSDLVEAMFGAHNFRGSYSPGGMFSHQRWQCRLQDVCFVL